MIMGVVLTLVVLIGLALVIAVARDPARRRPMSRSVTRLPPRVVTSTRSTA